MLGEMIVALSNFMYTYLLVILLVAAGVFFTIRNRFPQLRLLKESVRVVMERPEKEGSVSSFQALMVSTASRVGTGNIIGVSVAICVGGYGAVFWMWLIALLGGATAFTESTLAQIYKRRNPETGESYGGPAYYIEAALHSKPLAVLFALSLIALFRELIGSGKLFGHVVLGSAYTPVLIFILPAGAFLTMGFVFAMVNYFRQKGDAR